MGENVKVKIFSKKPCSYCDRAMAFFRQKGIPFEEVDLSNDSAGLTALKKQTGHLTVPQIFIDGKFIGGYRELIALHESGLIYF